MQVDLFDHVVLQSLLLDWGLSEHALSVLEKEPEIVAQLQQARSLPPFPADYEPSVIEERFDGINYRRWEFGHLVYESPCSSSYEPPFVEYCFDEQTALFHVNGEIVVNRLEKMASRAFLLGLLKSVP